jgi:hypothetical protein
MKLTRTHETTFEFKNRTPALREEGWTFRVVVGYTQPLWEHIHLGVKKRDLSS